MLTVTEANTAFEGHTYTSHGIDARDAGELRRWLDYVTEDGGTVTAMAGELPAGELARVNGVAARAGLRLMSSAPITLEVDGRRIPGYAVTYAARTRVA